MDKSKLAKFKVVLTVIYCLIALIYIGCDSFYRAMFDSNRDLAVTVFEFGEGFMPFVLLILPVLLVPVNIIISIIGMIKSRKVLPYLLCPLFSFVFWFIAAITRARYI